MFFAPFLYLNNLILYIFFFVFDKISQSVNCAILNKYIYILYRSNNIKVTIIFQRKLISIATIKYSLFNFKFFLNFISTRNAQNLILVVKFFLHSTVQLQNRSSYDSVLVVAQII